MTRRPRRDRTPAPNAPRTVAVVAPYYPPSVGGVQLYAERIAEHLRRRPDLRVVVVTSRGPGEPRVTRREGLTVVRLRPLLRVSNTPVHPLWPWTLRRLLRRHRVAVVSAHAPVPFLADAVVLAAGRVPVVLTYHAGSMVKGAAGPDRLIRAYERFVLPRVLTRADRLVSVSPATVAETVPGRLTISPGVDTGRFRPAPPGARPRRVDTLLYVGRMDRSSAWKGVDVLLAAFARVRSSVPDARLRLVGGGDAVPDLRQLAERLGVAAAIEFPGVLTGEALVEAYRDATVCVLPSRTAAESFGMVLVEAMACGCPVVGSAVGGITHVVADGETGLLVPPGDPGALAEACTALLRDQERAAALGRRAARHAAAEYAWEPRLAAYERLFRELAEDGRADPDRVRAVRHQASQERAGRKRAGR